MNREIFRIVPRVESSGDPILFLPDIPVSDPAMCICYARIGEHSVSTREYYRRKTRPDKSGAARALAEWYIANRCEKGERVRILARIDWGR